MSEEKIEFVHTPKGFAFGRVTCEVVGAVRRYAERDPEVSILVETTAGKNLAIYVSPKGGKIRVFRDGTELK